MREYFGKFGEIEAIEFSLDPESNKRQGSVFITYTEEEPVRNILEKFHTITGSKRSDNENENDSNTNASMIPSPKKKAKRLCCFNDKWKDTYDWIREVNNQNRAFCTICRKEFGFGCGREGDVKAHMETVSHKSRMRQASVSKPIKSVFMSQKDTSVQSKIAAAELAWAYHTNKHVLSYHFLDCYMKLSEVTFPDSEVATKISCG
ncbi:uncharacterized protein LOC105304797 isoform X2 [Pteropus vampyrus]|uniref:Uncharacterized protein LOC105304797 isoform X2 n=1 Tax=Pteropus vampyrus TaxID=132908 RepID=A0A6P6BTL2_PTEVA|nr:uncharacterized protein LOC105304797 isoform X2 [Pteropus vampyrus]